MNRTAPSVQLSIKISLILFLLLVVTRAFAECPPYEIPAIRSHTDYSKTVYIDPSASSSGNGSQSAPLTRLPSSLEKNTAYLIKRGTTHPAISRLFHSVLIGAYGQGAMPVVQGLDVNDNSHDATFRDLDIARKRSGTSDKVVEFHHRNISSNITIAFCKLRGISTDGVYPYYILHHSVDGLILFNNEIYNSHNNGWWLTSKPNIKIIRNWFHHLNRGGEQSTTNSGDGIQAEYGMEGFYFAGNIIDKSNAMWKYALMLNGEHHYNVVEYNTFFPPKAGAGGAGVRWMAQQGGIFRKNLVSAIAPDGQQLVVPFDTWDPHANKPEPYGIRDNHIVKASGGGVSTNGVVLHNSNAIHNGWTAYQTYLANNPGIGLYGSDITAENFWQPLCEEPAPVVHQVSFEVTCNHHKTPISDATITFDGTVLPAGQYTLKDLTAGIYHFTVSATGHEPVVIQDIEVKEDLVIPVAMPTLSFLIQAGPNLAEAGQVTGQGTYQYHDKANLTAQANESFHFLNWSENGQFVSSQPTLSFLVSQNRNLVAHFAQNESTQVYLVEVTANDSTAGTVTGQGNYSLDETATVSAAAHEGYSFEHWSENGETLSTNPTYSFVVKGNRDLVAHFTLNEIIQTFQVQVAPNDLSAGTVTGQGVYGQGQTASVTATPNDTYHFVHWLENGSPVSTLPFYSFEVNRHHNLVAQFDRNAYTLIYMPQPNGTLSGATEQNVEHGSNGSPVTAIPDPGYSFISWNDGSMENPRTDLMVTQNLTVYALFELTMNAGTPPEGLSDIQIYPVPAAEYLNADIPADETFEVTIINSQGQTVAALGRAGKGNVRYNLSNLNPGLYFIRFASSSEAITRKFLKQ